jgi:hypothetical protein
MSLQEGLIRLGFTGGINTKSDEKTVPTTELLVLENGVFSRATSLVKRNGYEALSTAVLDDVEPMSGAKRMAVRGSELLAMTDDRAYSYLSGPDRWVNAGRVEAPVMRDRVLAKTGSMQGQGCSAVLNGIRVMAWQDASAGGVWYSVLDDTSGALVRGPTQADPAGSRVRVVTCGASIHIYYASSAFIWCVRVDPYEPTTVIVPAPLAECTPSILGIYDAEPTTLFGDSSILLWRSDANTYRLGYVDPSGVLGSPVNGYPSVITVIDVSVEIAVAVAFDPNAASPAQQIAVLRLNGGTIGYIDTYHSATLAAGTLANYALVGVPARITGAWQRDDESGARSLKFFVEITAATERDHTVAFGSRTLGIAPTVAGTQRGAGLASRAFRDGSGVYAWLGHDVTYYAVALCVRFGTTAPLQCVARALPGIWHGLGSTEHLPGVWDDEDDTRKHHWTATYQEQLEAEAGNQFAESGLRVIDLCWDDDTSHQSAQLGSTLYMAGAVMQQYDGARWSEAGFHYAPDDIIAAGSAGGALTPSSVYEYVCWYEETLANGEVDRGAISVVTEIALSSSQNRVTLTVPALRLTGRRNVRLCIGRSEANTPGEYHRVTSINPSDIAGSNRFIANDPTVDTVTFVDDLSDEDLIERAEVYINGGVLENDPIPGGSIIASGKGRIFVSDPSNPFRVFYSQQLAEGYAAEFSPALKIDLDGEGGAVTGLHVMGDIWVITCESRVYYVAGDGPLAAPELGGGWSNPIRFQGDVGCVNGRSIEDTPAGLVFQAPKGIYLVPADRSGIRNVGEKVDRFKAQTVRSADLIADTTQIRFLTDDGSTLLYDYYYGQWSTFTNHLGLDAIVVDGVYHYLRNDGTVYRETPGVYVDATAPFKMRIETAWIKPGEILQQYMKVWYAVILGERKSPHFFRTQFRTNYYPSWSDGDAGEFDASTRVVGVDEPGGTLYGEDDYGDGPYGGSPGIAVFQWRLHLGQACEAIQFRFEDRQVTGQPGPSFELTELLLEVGLKARTFKAALSDRRSR